MVAVEWIIIMKLIFTLILLNYAVSISAQDSFYNYIEFGDYDIAFTDSVIYDHGMTYDQLGYNGPMPIFLKIWFPTNSTANNNYLTFGDFQSNNQSDQLYKVYDYLNVQIDTFFVKSYFETYEVKGYYDIEHTPTDFGQFSNSQVLGNIKELKTKSHAGMINTSMDYPVIIYHHGAQSSAEENYLLSELLASKGFIVVSAAYHLPYEGKMYGFEPTKFDDTALPKRVMEYARTITSNINVYFIGHSAGAQVGFRYLFEPEWASGFISLETSTEFWRRSSIKKGWKRLYKAVKSHRKDYTLSIMMIANTGAMINPFPLFDEIESAPMIHASSKVYFDHESYTSVYHMRYLIRDQIPQIDTENSKSQLGLYLKHLALIEGYISSLENSVNLKTEDYNEDFFFTKINIK